MSKPKTAVVQSLAKPSAKGAKAEPEALTTREIPCAAILESGANMRTVFDPAALALLAQSIRENGLLSPVLVQEAGNSFVLLGGARRLRAVRDVLKGTTILARVVPAGAPDGTATELAIHDNFRRVDISHPDRIRFIVANRKAGTPNKTLATWLGLSEQATSNDYSVGTKLLPEIFAAWENHPGATSAFVFESYAMTPEKQKEAWAAFVANKPVPADGGKVKGRRGKNKKGKAGAEGAGGNRRGSKEIDAVYGELDFLAGVTSDAAMAGWLAGARWGLQFCAGVPGAEVPKAVTDAIARYRAPEKQTSLFGRSGKAQPDAITAPVGGPAE